MSGYIKANKNDKSSYQKMKLIIPITLLLLSVSIFGQTQKTTTIELVTNGCNVNQTYPWLGSDTVFFYKLPEATIAFTVIPGQYSQFPIKLENIPVAEYRLTYENNYKQRVVKQITLTNQDINSIALCPDSLLNYPHNTLAKLQYKDTLSITFHSRGCYHSTLLKIIITKKADKFVATLYTVPSYYANKKIKPVMKNKGDSTLQTVTLTNKNIQDFIRFENELTFANDGSCTSTDLYDIKSKYLNIQKTDGGCTWRGFYYLRESFFGDKELISRNP